MYYVLCTNWMYYELNVLCCVNFECTAKWFGYMCIYIYIYIYMYVLIFTYMYSFSRFFSIIGYYKILSIVLCATWCFPDSSVGKESACNAGDPGSIPGSERLAGEGIGYLRQYSWPCLVAQLVKNPPAMQETWVWSLGWEDPLEKGKATHSSILAQRIPWTIQSMRWQKVGHNWATFTFCTIQWVLVVYLLYVWQCIYVNPKLLMHLPAPSPTSPRTSPFVTLSLFSKSVSFLLFWKKVHLYHLVTFHI